MNRIFKLIFVLTLMIGTFYFCSKNIVHAAELTNQSDKIRLEGVQVKYNAAYTDSSSGQNGMRFVGNFNGVVVPSGYTATYGIILSLNSELMYSDFDIANPDGVEFYSATGTPNEDGRIYLTLIDIPALQYNTNVYVKAFVAFTNTLSDPETTTYQYSFGSAYTSFIIACRNAYDADSSRNIEGYKVNIEDVPTTNICEKIADENRIMIYSYTDVSYCHDLGNEDSLDGTIKAVPQNSMISLIRGEYGQIGQTINLPSDVSISNSTWANELDNDGNRSFTYQQLGEVIFHNSFSVTNGNHIEFDSVTFDGDKALMINGNLEYVMFNKVRFLYNGTSAILDDGNHNINMFNVLNSYFKYKGNLSSGINDIKLTSNVSRFDVSSCIFDSDNDYNKYVTPINVKNVTAILESDEYYNPTVRIQQNLFNRSDAPYLILFGSSNENCTNQIGYSNFGISGNDFSYRANNNNGYILGLYKLDPKVAKGVDEINPENIFEEYTDNINFKVDASHMVVYTYR